MQIQSTAFVSVGSPVNSVKYDADMATVNSRLDALEKSAVPVPPGKVTVDSASYESIDGRLKKDVTAEVQALQDSGVAYYVHSDTNPHLADPFFKVVKLLRVKYSVGGVARPDKVFAQYDRIVLN